MMLKQGWSWPVNGCLLQVQSLTDVVSQDEGEDGILHEIVEGAARVLVEMGEVLKVGYLSWAPQVREGGNVAVLQQVGQLWRQDVVVDIITELRRKRESGTNRKLGLGKILNFRNLNSHMSRNLNLVYFLHNIKYT